MAVAGVVGALEILISPKLSDTAFHNSARRAARSFTEGFSNALQGGGGANILAAMGVAVAAVGAASIKLATEYEESFNKIRALTDTTTEQIKTFDAAIKDMAKSTGIGPNALANALYFVQSAGLSAKDGIDQTTQAIDILQQSANLAVIGFGDLNVNAELLTSAMNAYEESNLSASQAADTFVSAVKNGKLEANEFASALGRIIPLASSMGVELDQVTSFLTKVSQTGTSAAEGVTQLSGILNSVLQLNRNNLSKSQRSALAIVGIDPRELRKAIETDFTGAITMLTDKMDELDARFGEGAGEGALSTLIPNIRALRGLLAAAGGESGLREELKKTQEDASGVGVAYRSLVAVQDEFGNKVKRAFQTAQAALVSLGQNLIKVLGPPVEKIGSSLSRIFSTDSMQTFLKVLGGAFLVSLVSVLETINFIVDQFAKFFEQLDKIIDKTTEFINKAKDIPFVGDALRGVGNAASWTGEQVGLIGDKVEDSMSKAKGLFIGGASAAQVYLAATKEINEASSFLNDKDFASFKALEEAKARLEKRNTTVLNAPGPVKVDPKILEEIKKDFELIEQAAQKMVDVNNAAFGELDKAGKLKDLGFTLDQIKNKFGSNNEAASRFFTIYNDQTLTATERTSKLQGVLDNLSAPGASAAARMVRSVGLATEESTENISKFKMALQTALEGQDLPDGSKIGGLSTFFDDALGLQDADRKVQEVKNKIKEAKRQLSADNTKINELDKQIGVADRARALREADDKIKGAKKDIEAARSKAFDSFSETNTAIRKAETDLTTGYLQDIAKAELAVTNARIASKSAAINVTEAENALADKREAGLKLVSAVEKAERELLKKHDDVRKATNAVRVSQEEYSNKLYDVKKASREVEEAQYQVTLKVRDVRNASEDVVRATRDYVAAQVEAESVALDYVKAQQDVSDAYLDVQKASLGVEKAALNVVKAQLDYRKSTEDIVSVQNEQRDAFVELQDKANGVVEAQSALNKVISETGSQSRKTLDALNALRDAQLGVRSSALDVADAQDKLNKARRDAATGVEGKTRTELIREVERAKIDLDRARNAATDASRSVIDKRTAIAGIPVEEAKARADALLKIRDAQKALADQQTKALSFNTKVEDAQLKARDAALDIKDARLGEKEAVNDVSKANLGLRESIQGVFLAQQKQIDYANKVLDLALKIRDSQDKVKDAQHDVKTATDAVSDAEQARIKSMQELQQASDKIKDAEFGLTEARGAVLDQLDAIREAQGEVAKHTREYNLELEKMPIVIEKYNAVLAAQKIEETDLANVKATLKDREDALAKARYQHKIDLDNLKDAEDRLGQAQTDRTTAVLKNQRDELKAAKDLKDEKAKLDLEYQKLQDELLVAQRDRDLKKLEFARIYPGPDGSRMTETEYLSAKLELESQYIKMIGDKYPEVAKTANQAILDAATNLDPVLMAQNVQASLDKINGLTLKVTTVIDDKANLAIQLGGVTAIASQKLNYTTGSGTTINGRSIGNNWMGGPVAAGDYSWVNERGPEKFWGAISNKLIDIPGGKHVTKFNEPGIVVPHGKGFGAGGVADYRDQSQHVYNINTTTNDPLMVARQFERQARRNLRRASR
jgi:TP901 family phage tail tape measure protein